MAVYGPGKVVIKHKNEEGERIIVLNEVYYAPKGNQRLLSVIKLTKQGYTCTVDDKTRIWDTQGRLLITASPVSNRSALHWFTSVTMTPRAAMNHLELNASYDIWHKRLGHCSKNAIRHLSTATSNFPAITVPETSPPCRGCLLGKATQRSFPPSEKRGSKPLDLVHTDLAEFPTLSRHQNKWMITFIDDYSSFGCIMFLKRKSDAIDRFKDWLAWAENQSDLKLKRLRSDRGGEYISQDLSTFLNSRGIEHQKTVPRTPQQNGRAERFNRTICEKSEAMRLSACLPPTFWQDSVETALHIYNRQPMRRGLWTCPITLWNKSIPDISYFRIFGTLAYVFIPKEDRANKLAPKSEEMIFIGYEPGTKGYRFWSNNKRRVVISTTAVFNEYIYPNCSKEKNKPDNLPLHHTESRSTSDQDSSGSDTDSEDGHEDDGLMLRAINPGNPQPQQANPINPYHLLTQH
jgi:transposase InsO family protein